MTRSPDPAQLEADRKAAFARRRFDPESYAEELAPELPADLQVAIAAGELEEIDNPSVPTSQAQEELARQKAESDRVAREFCFLDPADYADEEARRGRVLTPQQLLELLEAATGKKCWCSLATEGFVRKELTPREIALAKLKIGSDPRNLYDPARWAAAIREVKQEERNLVPLRPYKLFALQICRQEGKPEYCCWFPGCLLREYDLVRFDSHNVPEQQIRGWRTVLIEVIRKGFAGEEAVTRVFGEAVGPASKRYNMVLSGLRHRGIGSSGDRAIEIQECTGEGERLGTEDRQRLVSAAASDPQEMSPPHHLTCSECHHHHAHFSFCSQYEAWYNGLGTMEQGAAGIASSTDDEETRLINEDIAGGDGRTTAGGVQICRRDVNQKWRD